MPVPFDAFKIGDVYIDYPFENAKFRYEKQTDRRRRTRRCAPARPSGASPLTTWGP